MVWCEEILKMTCYKKYISAFITTHENDALGDITQSKSFRLNRGSASDLIRNEALGTIV